MVDWDRVEELRSKGWDWRRVAADPKVGFRPDASAGEPGRALRALYRRRGRGDRPDAGVGSPQRPARPHGERGWTVLRVGYLLVPLIGIWFGLAYLVPSPVGLIVPAIPDLAFLLAGAALLLLYALWRATRGPRWSALYRTTVLGGVIVGVVVAGTIALVATLVFGCPYLPPASSETPVSSASGWVEVPARPWQDGGRPVVYFYGAVWCPYCSASSWAIWKALTEFGSTSGNYTAYSYGGPEPSPYTPEMVLGDTQMGSLRGHGPAVAFEVSEYIGSQDGIAPGTSSCYQSAYVSAYSGLSLPFVVVNGQYLHAMNTLVNPSYLTTWAHGANGGAGAVLASVANERGAPWTDTGPMTIQAQCCWIVALVVKSLGGSVPTLSGTYGWSPGVTAQVWSDLNQTI